MNKKVDWIITLVPLLSIVALSVLFVLFPEKSNDCIMVVKAFCGDTLGVTFLMVGLAIFLVSLYLAFSKYGDIRLGGKDEKPKYSFFSWGSMMFTCGLAADILFYSFSEWAMYATNPHIQELGDIKDWAGVFPLFHWSLIPWSFYLVLAVAFGFVLHVRKCDKHKYSEACRAILGDKTDKLPGRLIDLLAVFALIAGTATTFSVATPLMSHIFSKITGLNISVTTVTIVILLITCAVYTFSLLHGIKGINRLAKLCIYLFFALLGYVLLFGGQTRFIVEEGFESLGRMVQNFIGLSTYTDTTRTTNFPQDWTIYFWAYWMVWCVAAPFFIGNISQGRTIKQVIIGGYGFGALSTILSFIVLGNYALGRQVMGLSDFIAQYQESGDTYELITDIIDTMPLAPLVYIVVFITMIAFYSTSFDSIALTAAHYSYRKLEDGETPAKAIELMWCILLILLPIALVFSESSMSNIQSVSIIAALPLEIVIVLIVMSFFKDAKKHIATPEKKG